MEVALPILALVSWVAIAAAIMGIRASNQARSTVEHVSRLDPLTGLANRQSLEEDLDALTGATAGHRPGGGSADLATDRADPAAADQAGTQAADQASDQAGDAAPASLVLPSSVGQVEVMLLELARFGAINETYGHEIGDALMVAAGDQLRRACKPNERLYRYSGPQFAIVRTGTTSRSDAQRRAHELAQSLAVPFTLGRDSIRISARVGLTVTDKVRPAKELVNEANVALLEATRKDSSSGAIVAFELSMADRMTPATAERRLREALAKEQFWLHFMPLVDLADNRLVGVEALLRWADPEHGVVAPRDFLQALDETGLIVPVGEWTILEACRYAHGWQTSHPKRDITVTINVSPRQLLQSNFVDVLMAAIEHTGVSPDGLCIEITEGGYVYDVEATWGQLRQVKNLGVQLALDDFGTGFASIGFIRQFQLDVVKIERTFVKGVASNREDLAIVQQLIGMAHALGITVVAEGVDNDAQATVLQGLGCDLAQGYYFTTPQPPEVIDKLITRGRIIPGELEKQSIDWSGT